MPSITRLQKYVIIGVGTLGGAGLFYANVYGDRGHPQVSNSWTTNFTPSVKWDKQENITYTPYAAWAAHRFSINRFYTRSVDWRKLGSRPPHWWIQACVESVYGGTVGCPLPVTQLQNKQKQQCCRRDPKSLVKPAKINNESDENKRNEEYETKKSKATRHLILIRHGQYNTLGKTDAERVLTELGRLQAESTGARLAELALPYNLVVRSTMSRAQETSKIIEKFLTGVPVEDDGLLIEGAPIPPEPPLGHWRSERYFYEDGPRIEAAFRRYFHRADPDQEKDSYTLLICHANVIRYFVCRALQFPPEAWLRISLKNASITWISIVPSGRVTLRCLGEAGHMPPQNLTTT